MTPEQWEFFKTKLGATKAGDKFAIEFENAKYILEVNEIILKDPNTLQVHVADGINVKEKIS
jgi:hypothetical protein